MDNVKLMLGNNIDKLKELPDNFVDSIVTDPPYGLSFMNKKWDYDVPSVDFWKEVYRVLKPGGHILSFGGTRTYHRMVVNIEDAGFEIRDQIQWIYGSGFPKSLNIGKEVDKKLGNDREVIGDKTGGAYSSGTNNLGIKHQIKNGEDGRKTLPTRGEDFGKITKGNSEYEGWGTGLKPANEPIVLARKPISEKTITDNVLEWGTGGINVDGCRVGYVNDNDKSSAKPQGKTLKHKGWDTESWLEETKEPHNEGRFPANVILECICDDETHTNPNCPCRIMDEQSGEVKSTKFKTTLPKIAGNNIFNGGNNGNGRTDIMTNRGYEDTGGSSRFFYNAKVSKKERNMGLDDLDEKEKDRGNDLKCGNCDKWILRASGESCKCGEDRIEVRGKAKNHHPTLKPVQLMSYLCRLITPKGGIVLDPFMGSGSTGISALLEGFEFIGMEMDEEYFKIATERIKNYDKYKEFIKK